MKHFLLASMVFTSAQAFAILSPGYQSYDQIETAVSEVAEANAEGLTRKNVDDVTLRSVTIKKANKDGDITTYVDVGNLICEVVLIPVPKPPGFAGATSYVPVTNKCQKYNSETAVSTLKWDQIKLQLKNLASSNNDLSFVLAGIPTAPDAPLLTLVNAKKAVATKAKATASPAKAIAKAHSAPTQSIKVKRVKVAKGLLVESKAEVIQIRCPQEINCMSSKDPATADMCSAEYKQWSKKNCLIAPKFNN